MKVMVAQISIVPGQIVTNRDCALSAIAEARRMGADLVVFPEMLYGYLLGDLWEQDSFLRDIENADRMIRDASHGLTVLWGTVVTDWLKAGEDGRVRKYNAVLGASHGKWLKNGSVLGYWVPKTNMPKYRIFDDARHFHSAWKLAEELGVSLGEILHPFPVSCADGTVVRVGALICEDGWDEDYLHKVASLYRDKVDLLVDLSHSPWTYEKRRARERMLRGRVSDAQVPMLYVASVGLENNGKNLVLFDGGSCLVGKDGTVLWRARDHEVSCTMLDPFRTIPSDDLYVPAYGIAEIYQAVVTAMRIALAPFPRVVVGLSGGIDSAVTMGLLVLALGSECVLAVNMPSRHNSRTTRRLAKDMADACGVEYRVVPVTWLFGVARHVLRRWKPGGLTLENMQAVLRMFIQNTIAQAEGGVFLNNGNDTETALGYFTLNGDGRGAYAFLGNLPKGWVYELGRHINVVAGRTFIPEGVFTVRPAAELSDAQNPEKGGGDPIFYPYHDPLIRMWREKRLDPSWVLEHLLQGDLEAQLGCPEGTIRTYFPNAHAFVENLEWAWRSYHGSVFKRVQAPPILIVFRRAFGFDLRESIQTGPVRFPDNYAGLKERVQNERTLW